MAARSHPPHDQTRRSCPSSTYLANAVICSTLLPSRAYACRRAPYRSPPAREIRDRTLLCLPFLPFPTAPRPCFARHSCPARPFLCCTIDANPALPLPANPALSRPVLPYPADPCSCLPSHSGRAQPRPGSERPWLPILPLPCLPSRAFTLVSGRAPASLSHPFLLGPIQPLLAGRCHDYARRSVPADPGAAMACPDAPFLRHRADPSHATPLRSCRYGASLCQPIPTIPAPPLHARRLLCLPLLPLQPVRCLCDASRSCLPRARLRLPSESDPATAGLANPFQAFALQPCAFLPVGNRPLQALPLRCDPILPIRHKPRLWSFRRADPAEPGPAFPRRWIAMRSCRASPRQSFARQSCRALPCPTPR